MRTDTEVANLPYAAVHKYAVWLGSLAGQSGWAAVWLGSSLAPAAQQPRPPGGTGSRLRTARLSLLHAFGQGHGDPGLHGRFGVDQPLKSSLVNFSSRPGSAHLTVARRA